MTPEEMRVDIIKAKIDQSRFEIERSQRERLITAQCEANAILKDIRAALYVTSALLVGINVGIALL